MPIISIEPLSRKASRMQDYDYSNDGAYFVTICVKGRHALLGKVVGNTVLLSSLGEIAESAIQSIATAYDTVTVDRYVIMPNHVHLLLLLRREFSGCKPPTVSRIIQQWKGVITKQAGFAFWQRSFYDHIIKDSRSYQRIVKYIDENPLRWKEDRFFISDVIL